MKQDEKRRWSGKQKVVIDVGTRILMSATNHFSLFVGSAKDAWVSGYLRKRKDAGEQGHKRQNQQKLKIVQKLKIFVIFCRIPEHNSDFTFA
ncbi:hypothetical protein L596_027997 [Steinernema carpocapsae]|uniref:Uncharacterized protein n=1 Tax=Steinernema carpocapsae TaxID=34508 RepID=A0A4U5LX61_STECR|nr:hypothetical protein L596_027997 [Steinernema carpocapsae]